jgi:hypothetical protein
MRFPRSRALMFSLRELAKYYLWSDEMRAVKSISGLSGEIVYRPHLLFHP